MARPQNAPKGLFVKDQVNVGTTLNLGDSALTADSTGNLAVAAGVKLSGESTLLTANSTAVIGSVAQLTLNSMNMRLAANSTGTGLQINNTGTAWVWVSTTSVGPA